MEVDNVATTIIQLHKVAVKIIYKCMVIFKGRIFHE